MFLPKFKLTLPLKIIFYLSQVLVLYSSNTAAVGLSHINSQNSIDGVLTDTERGKNIIFSYFKHLKYFVWNYFLVTLYKSKKLKHLISSMLAISLHRYQRPDVGTVKPGGSLPKLTRPLHKLHIRRWQSGADVAQRWKFGPYFFATHSRSHRLRSHLSCRRTPCRLARVTNYPRTDTYQTQRSWWRIRPRRHPL